MEYYDVIIIGGGPAGMTSAIYTCRRNLKTLILEKNSLGGRMLLAKEIENYPGFESISGMELAERMKTQVEKFNAEIRYEEVIGMNFKNQEKEIITKENKYISKAVIIATGSEHKRLEIKGEKEFLGRGVSYCATCDAPFFRNKIVAVVGGGNSAVNEALYLSNVAEKVYIIHRRNEFRAEDAKVKELLSKENVEPVFNTIVEEILGDGMVNRIRIKNLETEKESFLNVDGIFIAIGNIPATSIAKSAGVSLDEKGFIIVDKEQKTNIPGVFAAGDCTGGLMQISVAVGEGSIAGVSAYKYVKNPYWK